MTRRWLPWITTLVVGLGAAATAAPSGAQAGPDLGLELWDVTIETADQVTTRDLVVSGRAVTHIGGHSAQQVAVRVDLLPPLPPACDRSHGAVIDVHEGAYRVEFPLACNGPYRIEVAVRSGGVPFDPETKDVGVAEKPPTPAPPEAVVTAGVMTVRWPTATDLDAAGWVLEADGVPQTLPPDAGQLEVPKDGFSHTYALFQMRWGAGGPGSEPLLSERSGETSPPTDTPTHGPDPNLPTEPADPPEAANPGSTSPPPASSSSTAPPTTAGREPSRGTGAPSTTLPEGYSDELPYGTPDDAFVPGDEPRRASGADEESAAGTSPSRGFVRTSEKQAPGLVAPFALGLMLITVAAHIAWYLRRSRPGGDGQVMPR